MNRPFSTNGAAARGISIDTLVSTGLSVEDLGDDNNDDEPDTINSSGDIGDFLDDDASTMDRDALLGVFSDEGDEGEGREKVRALV
eukprot:CAMPEP_0178724468 /NCGR_PEP_ID=MMETSP0699-20121125/26125_1 /TAXON_ID=265572 /ORGANISM="Extubocellulus spinifer, Strain CCMP396" /LENGTH=85 /DNA_ID=CAMNT_0020375675 /DNA_START=870 /DNA_END=1128 /DNA_ORIENTATION=+